MREGGIVAMVFRKVQRALIALCCSLRIALGSGCCSSGKVQDARFKVEDGNRREGREIYLLALKGFFFHGGV